MAKVKCPVCEEQFERDEGTKVKNRYYHPDCLEEMRERNKFLQENPNYVEESSQGEENDYRALISYICHKYDLKKPSGQILKQVQSFKAEFDYTYKGMELTLRYFHDTEKNPVRDDSGIGIIPYVYERATNYHIKKIHIGENLSEVNMEPEVRTIITKKRTPRTRNLIDINDL